MRAFGRSSLKLCPPTLPSPAYNSGWFPLTSACQYYKLQALSFIYHFIQIFMFWHHSDVMFRISCPQIEACQLCTADLPTANWYTEVCNLLSTCVQNTHSINWIMYSNMTGSGLTLACKFVVPTLKVGQEGEFGVCNSCHTKLAALTSCNLRSLTFVRLQIWA